MQRRAFMAYIRSFMVCVPMVPLFILVMLGAIMSMVSMVRAVSIVFVMIFRMPQRMLVSP